MNIYLAIFQYPEKQAMKLSVDILVSREASAVVLEDMVLVLGRLEGMKSLGSRPNGLGLHTKVL